MQLLAAHHTSLESDSEEGVDRSIAEWKGRYEAELAAHREMPEGREVTLRDCCSTRTLFVLPSWLPSPALHAPSLFFRFRIQKKQKADRWVAHLSAELLGRRN